MSFKTIPVGIQPDAIETFAKVSADRAVEELLWNAIDAAEDIFGSIGSSPKRLHRRNPNLDRPYHGKEGKGRYKAFSIGQNVTWHSRILTNGSVQIFSVQLNSSQLNSATIGSATACDCKVSK